MAAPSIPDGLDELRDLLVDPERKAIAALAGAAGRSGPPGRATWRTGLPEALAHCSDDRRLDRGADAAGRSRHHQLGPPQSPPAGRRAVSGHRAGHPQGHRAHAERDARLAQPHARAERVGAGAPVAPDGVAHRQVVCRGRAAQHAGLPRRAGVPHPRAHRPAARSTSSPTRSPRRTPTWCRACSRRSATSRAIPSAAAPRTRWTRFRVGELNGLIEHGPHAYLAVVVRGTPPHDLRLTLAARHRGDPPAADRRPRAVLRRRLASSTTPGPCCRSAWSRAIGGRRGRSPIAGWWIGAGAWWLALLAAWVRPAMGGSAPLRPLPGGAGRRSPAWSSSTAARQGGRFVVSGLRDPLAVDPAVAGRRPRAWLPTASTGAGQLYQALDPRLAAAARRSRPAAAARRAADDARRHAGRPAGEAPSAWVRDALAAGAHAAGRARRFDLSGLQNAELREASRRLEAAMVQFVRGTPELVPGQDEALARDDRRAAPARLRRAARRRCGCASS